MTDELPSADDVDSAPSDDDYGEEDTFMEDVVGTERNVTADGGVRKKIILKGQGYNTPENGDEVSVHYVGTLLDGTKFDSSRDRDQPFTFKLGAGQVIRGWDEGVATMKKGEKSLLTCLPDYAYGKSGSPPTIPPDATLQFEVELLSWKSKKDLTGDGGVVKTILAEGSGWQRPRPDDEVLGTMWLCFSCAFALTRALSHSLALDPPPPMDLLRSELCGLQSDTRFLLGSRSSLRLSPRSPAWSSP